jgi:glycosyltransferase involved in cell wall biosynthesis
MPDEPLISCLMVTLPVAGRLERLKQSVAGYLAQTHRRRELVVVVDGRTPAPDPIAAIKAHLASLGRDDIRVVEPRGVRTLGALRNVSMASARGDVFCQWDDDDLHHPLRLERQLAALAASHGRAVCLQEVMQFFAAERRLYCTNWRATEVKALPGTLMCRAASAIAYCETGEPADLSEDLELALRLIERDDYEVLAGEPHLYVYVSHGENSWADEHHRMLAARLGLSQGLLRRRAAALREGLAAFDFGPGPVTVQGANGPAFTVG